MSAVATYHAAVRPSPAVGVFSKTARAVVGALRPRLRVEPRLFSLDVDGEPVASSTCALWLEYPGSDPVLFLPREDVRAGVLRPTDRGRVCPRAGMLRYLSLRLNGLTIERAAKRCEHPTPTLERLKGFVSFDLQEIGRIGKVRPWRN